MNEFKRMQKLAGLITESEYRESINESKYISSEEQEDEDYPVLNDDAIRAYLKSVIDPEYIDDVDTFMDDEEGYGESSMYFFDTPDDEDPFTIPDSEVERWAKQEMSYYLFSQPDEFPSKEMNESPLNEAEMNPVTKKKFDNLLAMAEKAVAEKDKETLQKIYDKALTTGSKGWKYFIQALYDKGLAHQDGAYLKWNLDESSLNEADKKWGQFTDYQKWKDALLKLYPFIAGKENKYFHKEGDITKVGKGYNAYASWYDGNKGLNSKPFGYVKSPNKDHSWVIPVKELGESSLNEAEKYGGQSADRGATGSSIEFTIVDNTPEYYTIDYKITPNSRYSSKTASRYNVREPKEGRERIKKDPNAVQKEWIRVSGDDFLIGKSFAKEIYPENSVNENLPKTNNLKLYHDVLMDIGGGDLAGDYKDILSKANDFKSFSDFVKDDLSILSQDDEDQVNDIKSNFVEAKLRKMSPEEFTNFTKKMGDYDFWSDAPNGIDPFNNVGQRMDVLSTNDEEDTNKYFNALIK